VVSEVVAGTDLVVLLRLPPPRDRPKPEPAGPGRQGGAALAAAGMVFAVLGVVLWLLDSEPALVSAGIAVTGVGIVEMVAGLALAMDRWWHERGEDASF
jgi:hypothetical protein